jgi:hypothetical protein
MISFACERRKMTGRAGGRCGGADASRVVWSGWDPRQVHGTQVHLCVLIDEWLTPPPNETRRYVFRQNASPSDCQGSLDELWLHCSTTLTHTRT